MPGGKRRSGKRPPFPDKPVPARRPRMQKNTPVLTVALRRISPTGDPNHGCGCGCLVLAVSPRHPPGLAEALAASCPPPRPVGRQDFSLRSLANRSGLELLRLGGLGDNGSRHCCCPMGRHSGQCLRLPRRVHGEERLQRRAAGHRAACPSAACRLAGCTRAKGRAKGRRVLPVRDQRVHNPRQAVRQNGLEKQNKVYNKYYIINIFTHLHSCPRD